MVRPNKPPSKSISPPWCLTPPSSTRAPPGTTLIERRQVANPVTLKPLFEADEALNDAGGAKYLARLAAWPVATFKVRAAVS